MKMRLAGAVTAAALLTLSNPGPVLAAPPVRSLTALKSRVQVGTEVVVTNHEGSALVGKFVLADGDGVLIDVPGARKGRRIPAADVATVTRVGDSWARGIVIGAGAGVLPALAYVNTPKPDRVLCTYGSCQPSCVSDACRVVTGISIVAVGAAIGAIIDRNVVGREVVFEVSRDGEPMTLSLVPYPVRRGGGVRAALSF